jgi:hypothetical protein
LIFQFTFKVGMQRVFGSLDSLDIDALDAAYAAMERGYNSMPIHVPGTKYYASMKVLQAAAEEDLSIDA